MALPNGVANRHLIRRINQAVILRLVRELAPVSRTDLVDAASLSPATVSDITAELLRDGMIRERETGRSTGGRRPILLTIDPDAGLAIGAKLTEHRLVTVVTDFEGTVVEQDDLPLGGRTPDAVVAAIGNYADAVAARHPSRHLFGLGLGLAGAIDREDGLCRFSPFLRWRDVPLRDLLETRIRRPVVIENDVGTLTIAERWFGAGVGERDFLVVTLGRGVGLGMILHGRPYRGAGGQGGEFGHITVARDGPPCECGKRGCLEAIAGDGAIVRAASAALGRDVTLAAAADAARGGHPGVRAVFDEAGDALGTALATLVNLLNPTLLIVSGEGAEVLDLLDAPMRAALARDGFDRLTTDLRLTVDPWGDEAWARGAAGLLLEDLLTPRAASRSPGLRGRLERDLVAGGSTGSDTSVW
ncbi:MAG TPA: ROK family transcriptional regulator [Thermomicrobiales bacterium]|jgi:predicted NBD/HSP70 family sugar kinase|nr:ROK family transcriptional regulator [Thermomicrobiales bacterium]